MTTKDAHMITVKYINFNHCEQTPRLHGKTLRCALKDLRSNNHGDLAYIDAELSDGRHIIKDNVKCTDGSFLIAVHEVYITDDRYNKIR